MDYYGGILRSHLISGDASSDSEALAIGEVDDVVQHALLQINRLADAQAL